MSIFRRRHRRALQDTARRERAHGGTAPRSTFTPRPLLISYAVLDEDLDAATAFGEGSSAAGRLFHPDDPKTPGATLQAISGMPSITIVNRSINRNFPSGTECVVVRIFNEWLLIAADC